MFVHFFTHVARPREEVEDVLFGGQRTWLPAVVEEAYESGDGIRAKVGIGRNLRLTKKVLVHFAEPRREPHRTILPMRVEATGAASLFPRLDADLEIASVGADITQLTLSGSYRPPMGAAGELLDRAVLHRVAEAVAKNFVEQVTGILEEAASA